MDDLFAEEPDWDAQGEKENPHQRLQRLRDAPLFIEPCKRCGGTGKHSRTLPCRACKGKGNKEFKTSPEARAAQAEQRFDRRIEDAREPFKLDAVADALTDDQLIAIREAIEIVSERHSKRRGEDFTHGFSQADEWLASKLAIKDEFSRIEAAYCAHMLRKYRRQYGQEIYERIYPRGK